MTCGLRFCGFIFFLLLFWLRKLILDTLENFWLNENGIWHEMFAGQ